MSVNRVNVCGTELAPSDPPDRYRQKMARIALDSMGHLVGLLDAEGAVLDLNQAALDAAAVRLSDVEGQPFWTTFWWSASEEARVTLGDAIRRAAKGEFVSWDTEILVRSGGREISHADAVLYPVKDARGNIVFLGFEGRENGCRSPRLTDELEGPIALILAPLEDALAGVHGDLPPAAAATLAIARRNALRLLELVNGTAQPEPQDILTLEDLSLPADSTEQPRILLADGNADMRTYLRRLLADRFDVQAVADGEAALAAAQDHPPDLILAASAIARLDGAGLLRALRADPNLRDTPVILLSSRSEIVADLAEAGPDDYLVAPFTTRELIARLDTHLKLAKIRRQAKEAIQESESVVSTFADAAPAILWTTRANGECNFVSRGWYEFTGQTEGAALGFGWLDHVHPEDREDARRLSLEGIAARQPFSVTFRLRRADGEFHWASSSGRPHFSKTGDLLGYTGSVTDIHEHKQAAVASSLLRAIVDSCDDAIISKDLNGIITSWNQGAERLFGYTPAEAVGRSIEMLIPADRLNEEPRILAQLRLGQRVDHFETIRVRKDGTKLNISLTISPVKDADGRVVGASKVARDITHRVRHEQELRAANAALERANADLQQFAYSASHDLQEPLRMVVAYSELLHSRFTEKLGPKGEEYLNFTVQGAIRMENLLRDLRTYMRVSISEQEPAPEVNAENVFDKAVANLAVAISESGASVTRTALPHVDLFEFQLEQLLQNLIGNAIRYRSQAPPQIHVAAVRQGDMWLFSVQDNGIGIEPDYKEQIFGIFKRLHRASDCPGTGMGLAICQRIVQRAGGRIWVESEPGRGSTFYFTVPNHQFEQERSAAQVFHSGD